MNGLSGLMPANARFITTAAARNVPVARTNGVATRGHRGARRAFLGKIDRRAIIDCRPPATVGSMGARRYDRAVGLARARRDSPRSRRGRRGGGNVEASKWGERIGGRHIKPRPLVARNDEPWAMRDEARRGLIAALPRHRCTQMGAGSEPGCVSPVDARRHTASERQVYATSTGATRRFHRELARGQRTCPGFFACSRLSAAGPRMERARIVGSLVQ